MALLPLLIDLVAAEATLTDVSCTLREAACRLLVALRVMRVALLVIRPMLRDTVWLLDLDIPEASESASSELPSSRGAGVRSGVGVRSCLRGLAGLAISPSLRLASLSCWAVLGSGELSSSLREKARPQHCVNKDNRDAAV